jgi:eukaryotic-like serine/threonine-protein kinase
MDVFTPVAPRGMVVGRYAVYDKLAAGARAEVWLGRARGQPGSPPLVIKRLHRELLCDPVFVSAVVTDARRCSTVEHPNLATVRDVALIEARDLLLVSEYFAGETLAQLFGACFRSRTRMPLPVAVGIMIGVLHGLEAAHQARDGSGASPIVHGGLSPQNVLVGADGVPRVLDFGLATARTRAPAATALYAQGKRAYMSPEQARGQAVDGRTDVYAAAVILWELLAGERLFRETAGADIALQITTHRIPRLSELHPDLPAPLDEVLASGLARAADARPATAAAFARALEAIVPPASAAEIASWIGGVARERLARRAELVAAVAHAPDPPEPLHGGAEGAAVSSAPSPWVVSAPTATRRSHRPHRSPLVVLVGALASCLLIVSALAARRHLAALEQERAQPRPASTAVSSPPRFRVDVPSPPSALPPPVALPPATAPMVAVERAAQPRVAKVPAAVGPARARPRAAVDQNHRARVPPAAPGCQPPFTVDDQGIRRVKRECLK